MSKKDFIIEVIIWVFTFLAALFGLWLILSFFDIVTHNIESYKNYAQYQPWNFFILAQEFLN